MTAASLLPVEDDMFLANDSVGMWLSYQVEWIKLQKDDFASCTGVLVRNNGRK